VGKYFEVVESRDVTNKANAASTFLKDIFNNKLSEVTNEIPDLKQQLQAVVAQNQRLQEQHYSGEPIKLAIERAAVTVSALPFGKNCRSC
jgi:hypothetical protein